jgi:4'-phosphopantetheinyl transferase EntD
MVAFSTLQHSLKSVFPNWVLSRAVMLRLPQASRWPHLPEQICVAGASAIRQREFVAGRLCARAMLRELGYDDFALMTDRDSMPLWPADISGSISHTSTACAVAVALKTAAISIGLDIELYGRVTPDLWPYIATPDELHWILNKAPEEQGKWAALVFSAKECFHKCQFPVTRTWLDFHDARIAVKDRENQFEVQVNGPLTGIRGNAWVGQYRFAQELVVTGMVLRAGRGRA